MTRLAIVSACVVICAGSLAASQDVPAARPPARPSASAMPPRDAPMPDAAQGVGTLVGRVTSAATGKGLRGAVVTAYPIGGGRSPMSARADDQGRYRIEGVGAGAYGLYARHPSHLTQAFGQTTPRTPERRVSVTANVVSGPFDFPLLRGAVIAGRVFDELGEPVERVRVRASKLRRFGREWRLLDVGETTETDDLGEYRLFRLPPGDYVVRAEPLTRAGAMSPESGQARGLVTTWAPSVPTPAEAQRVGLEPGVEGQADIRLVSESVATVAGRAIDSSGQPIANGSVRLTARGGITGVEAGRTWLGPDGFFRFRGVPPGPYTVVVEPRRVAMDGAGRPAEEVPEVGVMDVDVAGQSLLDLLVRTDSGAIIRGRLVVDGDPTPLSGRTVFVMASPIDPDAPIQRVARAQVREDLSFELIGVRGPVLLRLTGVPDGWWTRAVRRGGADVTDGIDPRATASIDAVDVVVSTRPTAVRGRVTRTTGASADAVVLLFTTDERRWEESVTAARTTLVRTDEGGVFRTATMRPGSYYVVALNPTDVHSDDLGDPGYLRELAPHATRVDVAEGQVPEIALSVP